MMIAMGRFNGPMRKGKTVSQRIQNLIELKAAAVIRCEFCVDLGSADLPQLRPQRRAAAGDPPSMSQTRCSPTPKSTSATGSWSRSPGLLTLVNLDRFNAAFKIGSAGFSEGMGLRIARKTRSRHARADRGRRVNGSSGPPPARASPRHASARPCSRIARR
jgi:hypothetical protein